MKLDGKPHNLSGDIRDAGGVQKVMLRGDSARTFSLTVETLDAGYSCVITGPRCRRRREIVHSRGICRASGEIAALPTAFGAE